MKWYLLFSILLTSAVTSKATPSAPSKPTPPPNTEVYATASDGTPLDWIVYEPAGRGPWPAVLVIHGGFFIAGSADDTGVANCAQDLANAGYLAFSINYRLAPPGKIPGQQSLGRFPDQTDDVHLAVQAARNDPRCNGRVGAVGGSSGGSHVAWCAVTGTAGQDRIDVGVSLSGAYDYSDFSPDPEIDFFVSIVTNYVGVPRSDIAALRVASPAWVVNKNVAPLFLIDSLGDPMPAAQLDDMAAQLTAVGARNYNAMRIAGALHSFEYWPQVKADALSFLAAVLNGKTR